MEWLGMIAKPTTGNYGPGSFLSKVVIKTECQIESDWVKFWDLLIIIIFFLALNVLILEIDVKLLRFKII